MSGMSSELIKQFNERYNADINLNGFVRKIETLVNAGRLEEACKKCLESSEEETLKGAAWYYLGIIYWREGDYDAAVRAFEISLREDYKRIESLDGIASCFFEKKEYVKAIATYEKVQDEKGYDGRIWCNIGICYNFLNQCEKAIPFFDKGIDFDKTDAFPYYNKGISYFKMKKYDKAKSLMAKAIELDPQNEIYRREYKKCIDLGYFI